MFENAEEVSPQLLHVVHQSEPCLPAHDAAGKHIESLRIPLERKFHVYIMSELALEIAWVNTSGRSYMLAALYENDGHCKSQTLAKCVRQRLNGQLPSLDAALCLTSWINCQRQFMFSPYHLKSFALSPHQVKVVLLETHNALSPSLPMFTELGKATGTGEAHAKVTL